MFHSLVLLCSSFHLIFHLLMWTLITLTQVISYLICKECRIYCGTIHTLLHTLTAMKFGLSVGVRALGGGLNSYIRHWLPGTRKSEAALPSKDLTWVWVAWSSKTMVQSIFQPTCWLRIRLKNGHIVNLWTKILWRCPAFRLQWRIQDFPEEGAPIPMVRVLTCYLVKNFLTTAWKWKNLNPRGRASLAPPPLRSVNGLEMVENYYDLDSNLKP